MTRGPWYAAKSLWIRLITYAEIMIVSDRLFCCVLGLVMLGTANGLPVNRLKVDSSQPSDFDECDSVIWEHDKEQTSGVRNVFAHCSEGHITWKNNGREALQVSFQPSFHLNTGAFEACFVISSIQNSLKISMEDERGTRLKTLIVLNSTQPKMPREICLKSKSSQPVILYLESSGEDMKLSHLGEADLEYDIQAVREALSPAEDMEECRPCTDEEVLESVCTSDFVIKGSMAAVFNHLREEETEIFIDVAQIQHQKNNLFKVTGSKLDNSVSFTAAISSPTSVKTFVNDSGSLGSPILPSVKHPGGGSVTVPMKCGIRHGQGQFVFMGRIRLKRGLLQCAPRVEDFRALWRRAIRTGQNLCVL